MREWWHAESEEQTLEEIGRATILPLVLLAKLLVWNHRMATKVSRAHSSIAMYYVYWGGSLVVAYAIASEVLELWR